MLVKVIVKRLPVVSGGKEGKLPSGYRYCDDRLQDQGNEEGAIYDDAVNVRKKAQSDGRARDLPRFTVRAVHAQILVVRHTGHCRGRLTASVPLKDGYNLKVCNMHTWYHRQRADFARNKTSLLSSN